MYKKKISTPSDILVFHVYYENLRFYCIGRVVFFEVPPYHTHIHKGLARFQLYALFLDDKRLWHASQMWEFRLQRGTAHRQRVSVIFLFMNADWRSTVGVQEKHLLHEVVPGYCVDMESRVHLHFKWCFLGISAYFTARRMTVFVYFSAACGCFMELWLMDCICKRNINDTELGSPQFRLHP